MEEINFKKIEEKWQKKWAEKKIFEVTENSKKKKFYVLEMFPYPSGDGLHMGHALNYVIGDVLARFKIMNGFNVLHPMGYDALGLPAENAAIKNKTHPEEYTNKAIKNYISQQKGLGISYDWTRMVNTASPDYYKWDQWIFLKMFEKNLAYQKISAVNWCPKCESVLANEQVHDGKCWRHEDTEVEIKHLKQWFFKITNYADELYEEIDNLNWPDRTKAMQKNWIGKSHGTEIDFEIVSPKDKISNVVIVHGCPNLDEPKNPKERMYDKHWLPWIKEKLIKKGIKCETPLMPEPWNPTYESWKKEFEKLKIDTKSILIGHSAGTTFLVRWLGETKKKIKKLILVASWKEPWLDTKENKEFCKFKIDEDIKELVEEIIIFTSDYSEEKKRAIFFDRSLSSKLIELKGRGHFIENHMKTKEFPELLDEILSNKKWPIFTTRPDTIFGVTFMVVSAQHEKLFDLVTKEQKKKVEEFLKKIKSVSQKSIKDLDKLDKEGVFTGSYAINPATNEKVPIYAGNFVVADYGSGMVMAVPAHDPRDFEFAKKYGIEIKGVILPEDNPSGLPNLFNTLEIAYTGKGKLINSKEFNNLENEKAKQEITKWLEKKNKARKVVNFRLRDWLISRQRYWGTPIPIVHCEKCGVVPVPEKELPIILPKEVKFGKGNPLLTNEKWINTKCPKCGAKARRETDTMDTFVNSSWYYLRYCDSKNNNKIFDSKKTNYWCPIDQYIGGSEHACMHLIYVRFYTKFLADLGLINFREPAKKLFHQGMLAGEGGLKMSKSKGNVVNPEAVSEKYGIDTARYFLLSLASPDKPRDWSETGIQGSLRFIRKIMNYFGEVKFGKSSDEIISLSNKTIKEVSEEYENFDYRTATIKLKSLFDKISEEKEQSKEILENFLKLLNPICPHITEELWEKIGGKNFISNSDWPKIDETKINTKNKESKNNFVEEIKRVIEKVEEKKKVEKVYLYVLPFEISKINKEKISKEIKKPLEVFAVNDSKKYDPDGKSKNAKPNKPGIYVE